MKNKHNPHQFDLISHKDAKSVFGEVERIYWLNYSPASFKQIKRCYKEISRLFKGTLAGYRACTTEYHDLSHTMDVMLASMRLLDGYNQSNTPIPEKTGRNCLIAALFHDTGYIQESGDDEGTGAKYAKNHVDRSVHLLEKNHKVFSVDAEDVGSISAMIQGTGSSAGIKSMGFSSEDEETAGKILGVSNLMGQMAHREYLEKLLFLYYEFREAGIPGFGTEFDILKKTVDFYTVVKKRFSDEFDSLHDYAKVHFKKRHGINANLYEESIDKNIAYLHKIIDDESSNFRSKLKRGDWVSLEKAKTRHQVQ